MGFCASEVHVANAVLSASNKASDDGSLPAWGLFHVLSQRGRVGVGERGGAWCVISVQFNPIFPSLTASCSCNFIKIRQRTNTPLLSVCYVCIPDCIQPDCLCPSLVLVALLCAPCRLIAAPKWRHTLPSHTKRLSNKGPNLLCDLHFISYPGRAALLPSCCVCVCVLSTYEYAENCNWRKKDVSGY